MVHEWTFLTSHALVLIEVARDPECRIRDVAGRLDLTERRVQGVLKDLVDSGYLQRRKVGRGYRYRIVPTGRFRHPRVRMLEIRSLLALVERSTPASPTV